MKNLNGFLYNFLNQSKNFVKIEFAHKKTFRNAGKIVQFFFLNFELSRLNFFFALLSC